MSPHHAQKKNVQKGNFAPGDGPTEPKVATIGTREQGYQACVRSAGTNAQSVEHGMDTMIHANVDPRASRPGVGCSTPAIGATGSSVRAASPHGPGSRQRRPRAIAGAHGSISVDLAGVERSGARNTAGKPDRVSLASSVALARSSCRQARPARHARPCSYVGRPAIPPHRKNYDPAHTTLPAADFNVSMR